MITLNTACPLDHDFILTFTKCYFTSYFVMLPVRQILRCLEFRKHLCSMLNPVNNLLDTFLDIFFVMVALFHKLT